MIDAPRRCRRFATAALAAGVAAAAFAPAASAEGTVGDWDGGTACREAAALKFADCGKTFSDVFVLKDGQHRTTTITCPASRPYPVARSGRGGGWDSKYDARPNDFFSFFDFTDRLSSVTHPAGGRPGSVRISTEVEDGSAEVWLAIGCSTGPADG